MLKSPLLFSIGVLVSLLSWTTHASANVGKGSMALNFSLPPTSSSLLEEKSSTQVQTPEAPLIEASTAAAPATIEQAIEPTTEQRARSTTTNLAINSSGQTQPAPTEFSLDSDNEQPVPSNIGVHFAATNLQLPTAANSDQQDIQQVSHRINPGTNSVDHEAKSQSLQNLEAVAFDSAGLDDWIFEGGSSSLVAHTVGSAEGTRLWDGRRTKAYYGHEDPGNGVWNLGTFSYQHEASSPEDADEKQLRRLKAQGLELEQQASNAGIRLSLEEKLNGLDLANQAPIAALGRGGYIERLNQAYRMKMEGFEAISWARTRSYIDPDTRTWNAPGLGNNLLSISQDQERRMDAINKALRAYDQNSRTKVALTRLETMGLEESASEPLTGEQNFGETDELLTWSAHFDSGLATKKDENEDINARASELTDSTTAAVASERRSTPLLSESSSPLQFGLPAVTASITSEPATLEGDSGNIDRARGTQEKITQAVETTERPSASITTSVTPEPESALENLQASVLQPIDEKTSSLDTLLATSAVPASLSTAEESTTTEINHQRENASDERLIATEPSNTIELIDTLEAGVQSAGSDQAALPTNSTAEPIKSLTRFADPAGKLQPLAAAPEESKSKGLIRIEDKVVDD